MKLTHPLNQTLLSKHDASEAEALLLGSVTWHLLFEVACDVLVLPASWNT